MTMQDDIDRYMKAAHAMQSGVMLDIQRRPDQTSDKHVRVGINSALVSDLALANLLIAKGVFTLEEYHAAVADAMEAEVKRYEDLFASEGLSVTLA